MHLSAVSEEDKEVINSDLEELIKASGDDIEYEFYFGGQVVNQNQTLFEMLKTGEPQLKKTLASPYSSVLQSLESNGTATIYFSIKDKGDEIKISRKDSMLEFSAGKRERTKSEAVDDISASSIN